MKFSREEKLVKIEKQPTFDKYPMFEWESEITILDNMTGNGDKGSDEKLKMSL